MCASRLTFAAKRSLQILQPNFSFGAGGTFVAGADAVTVAGSTLISSLLQARK